MRAMWQFWCFRKYGRKYQCYNYTPWEIDQFETTSNMSGLRHIFCTVHRLQGHLHWTDMYIVFQTVEPASAGLENDDKLRKKLSGKGNC